MANQAFTGSLNVVEEGETKQVVVSFFDPDGNPETPASISYRIIDIPSETIVRNDTSITPGESVIILLQGVDTALLNQDVQKEKRRMIVTAGYGATETEIGNIDYLVSNVKTVP